MSKNTDLLLKSIYELKGGRLLTFQDILAEMISDKYTPRCSPSPKPYGSWVSLGTIAGDLLIFLRKNLKEPLSNEQEHVLLSLHLASMLRGSLGQKLKLDYKISVAEELQEGGVHFRFGWCKPESQDIIIPAKFVKTGKEVIIGPEGTPYIEENGKKVPIRMVRRLAIAPGQVGWAPGIRQHPGPLEGDWGQWEIEKAPERITIAPPGIDVKALDRSILEKMQDADCYSSVSLLIIEPSFKRTVDQSPLARTGIKCNWSFPEGGKLIVGKTQPCDEKPFDFGVPGLSLGEIQEMVRRIEEDCSALRVKKFGDYGNSFISTYNDSGLFGVRADIGRKFERTKRQAQRCIKLSDLNRNYEELNDTLMDIINHALLSLVWLRAARGVYQSKQPSPYWSCKKRMECGW